MAEPDEDQRELIYDESVRALDEQAKVLEGLRSRVGVLISAAAISTTFLGEQALRDAGGLHFWAWSALGAFAVLGFCAIGVLFARGGWTFTVDAADLAQRAEKAGAWDSLPKMHKELASANAGYWQTNDGRLERRHLAFNVACIALVAEVAFWLLELAAH